MRCIVVFFGMVVSVLITPPCFAGVSQVPADANSLVTLRDYLAYAERNNAALKSIFQQFRAAAEAVPQAGALPDPKVTYGYFLEEVETRVGPQRQKFGIMQTFPWFGELEAQTDAASAAAKAASKRYEAERLKLFYQVKNVFYEYVYLARAVEITRQNLELLKHFEEVARTKYMAAAGSHPDVIRAQVELATLEDNLRSVEELRQPIVDNLNAILNRDRNLPLPWPTREPFRQLGLDRHRVIVMLQVNNPELQAMDFEITAARSRIDLAKKKFYPDISLGVDWIQTDDARAGGTDDSGKDPIVAMLSINLPIWGDSYKAAHRQAKARMRKASTDKVQRENDITAQASKVLYKFEDSNRKVTLYLDTLIPKAKEMLQASETAYQAGTLDFLSLIDAQQTLLNFELLYERSVTNNLQSLAQLDMLVGGRLEEAEKKTINR
ncbi:MAG: TolC family protein [Planctomycetota bacterium]|nr:MAG: TolC family protein [Planctomycetota bacterium]